MSYVVSDGIDTPSIFTDRPGGGGCKQRAGRQRLANSADMASCLIKETLGSEHVGLHMIHYRGGDRGKGKGGERRGWGATLYQSEMVLLIRWELFIWPGSNLFISPEPSETSGFIC